MNEKFKEKLGRMIPNPLRLALKMFGLVWFFLVLQVVLKLTFNYWQPYVIPTEQLQSVSDFIDSHIWLKMTIDLIYYYFQSIVVILCGIQQWKFKNIKIFVIVSIISISCYFSNIYLNMSLITPFIMTIILPIILDRKKWGYVLLTFALSNVFTIISLLLNGFTRTDNNSTIINMLFMNDYYIMLLLNYILFNIIRIKKENKNYGI